MIKDDVRRELEHLIRKHGIWAIDNRMEFERWLHQAIGERDEVEWLMLAVEDRIPHDLAVRGEDESSRDLIRTLVVRLYRRFPMTVDAAEWAVETWAEMMERYGEPLSPLHGMSRRPEREVHSLPDPSDYRPVTPTAAAGTVGTVGAPVASPATGRPLATADPLIDEDEYLGIWGGLLLLCLYLSIVVPIALIVATKTDLAQVRNLGDAYLALRTWLLIRVAEHVVFALLALRAGIRIWLLSEGAIASARFYLKTHPIWTGIMLFTLFLLNGLPSTVRQPIATYAFFELAALVIACAAWHIYIRRSVRVQVTFPEDTEADTSIISG